MRTDKEYSCLIVEDSPNMREHIVRILSKLTYQAANGSGSFKVPMQVTEAENGVDALRKLIEGRYDIILSDINMPVMDGLKLVKRVRSDPAQKNTPIVMITTESAAEDRQRALALGANAYIVKPVQEQELALTICKLLCL